jgi:hypothetical protein
MLIKTLLFSGRCLSALPLRPSTKYSLVVYVLVAQNFYNAWRQKAELFKKSSVIDHTKALKLQDSLFQRRGKIVD